MQKSICQSYSSRIKYSFAAKMKYFALNTGKEDNIEDLSEIIS